MESVDDLKSLSEQIAKDPESIQNISYDDVVKLRKYLHPFGTVVSSKKQYANLSIVNWKDAHIRKFTVTALIGYVYRLLEEYEDEDLREYLEGKCKDLPFEEQAAEFDRINTLTKNIIKKFFKRHFEFDTDHHVRVATSVGKGDPSRDPETEKTLNESLAGMSHHILEALKNNKEDAFDTLKQSYLQLHSHVTESLNVVRPMISTLVDDCVSVEDKLGILAKKYVELSELQKSIDQFTAPLNAADTIETLRVNPPADLFYHFDRYITNHYEQLHHICSQIYNEKPDVEYSVIFYGAFKDEEKAREYRIQHQQEFKTEVFTVENNGISIIGPFKENRAKLDFYNKNTEILKQMSEQMEADHNLGADLMKKRVKDKKKKNVLKSGPDAEGLAKYAKALNTVQALGVKKGLTKKEQDELYEARTIKEDFEVPPDAIQVDMFYTKDNKLERSKFYTQAEAPLHLQEGSEFVGKYQPVRDDTTVDTAYTTKKIISRKGEELEIKTMKN